MKKKKLIQSRPFVIHVYGISTPEKGYKLCWQIEQQLEISFLKSDNENQKNNFGLTQHDLYLSQNQDFERLILLENEHDGHYFYPKYKIADFFLIHFIDGSKHQFSSIKTQISSLQNVQTVFEIEFKNVMEESLFYMDV